MMNSSRFRTAVVGVGGIGSLHARTVSQYEGAELSVVVDAVPARAAQVGADLGVPYCLDVAEALASYELEAVIVAVPDTLHPTVAAPLLRAGIPVMLEKPIASSTPAAVELARLAAQHHVRLFIGHTLRFDPRYVGVYEAVRAGAVGRPVHAVAGRWTIRSRRQLVRETSTAPFDLGVHDIDALQWIVGEPIVEVQAYASEEADGPPPSCVVAACRFAGGVVGQLYSGWTRPDPWPNPVDSYFEVGGTEGMARVRVYDDGGLIVAGKEHRYVDALNARTTWGRVGGSLFESVRHFYTCLATSAEFAIGVQEAISAVAVAEAINRSVASGRPEPVERQWSRELDA
ncbi:MAG: Gfo/Idh/MocA family oxidoreductase [Acidimicrobiales bacterium]|jgi:predicted dehydrogenase